MGKHYFKQLDNQEFKIWKKNNTAVVDYVKTDQDMIDFGLKLKTLEGLSSTTSTVMSFYFPNLNEDEAALMAFGHHSHQDGISQM
jgi:hypothetical protein